MCHAYVKIRVAYCKSITVPKFRLVRKLSVLSSHNGGLPMDTCINILLIFYLLPISSNAKNGLGWLDRGTIGNVRSSFRPMHHHSAVFRIRGGNTVDDATSSTDQNVSRGGSTILVSSKKDSGNDTNTLFSGNEEISKEGESNGLHVTKRRGYTEMLDRNKVSTHEFGRRYCILLSFVLVALAQQCTESTIISLS